MCQSRLQTDKLSIQFKFGIIWLNTWRKQLSLLVISYKWQQLDHTFRDCELQYSLSNNVALSSNRVTLNTHHSHFSQRRTIIRQFFMISVFIRTASLIEENRCPQSSHSPKSLLLADLRLFLQTITAIHRALSINFVELDSQHYLTYL